MKKVLIIQTASIGDVVLATPVAESFYAHDPATLIDFMVRKGAEGLFTDHPFINEVLVWDKSQSKYSRLFGLLKEIRKRRYDYVITLQRFASSGFVTAFSRGRIKAGFSKNPFSFLFNHVTAHRIGVKDIHETDRNLALIENLTPVIKKVSLYPSVRDFESVQSFKSVKYITIAPSSLWYTKTYPVAKWVSFIKSLPESVRVYLLGSQADAGLCSEIIQNADSKNVLSLAGQLSLLQTTALMKDALMNYTNDSAPTHLASSVNAPVTTIYCSTVADYGFYPLSDQSYMVEVQEKLNCRPCGLHGYKSCPEKHFKCAENILNSQLINTLKLC